MSAGNWVREAAPEHCRYAAGVRLVVRPTDVKGTSWSWAVMVRMPAPNTGYYAWATGEAPRIEKAKSQARTNATRFVEKRRAERALAGTRPGG